VKIDHTNLGRTVSHALRHEPGVYGLTLDAQGWVCIADLLRALRESDAQWAALCEADLSEMVRKSAKVRHEIEGGRIRALYGHSTPEPLGREANRPPSILFHGTSPVAAEEIRVQGLKPMSRQKVHLSVDEETALQVGRRKSPTPVILRIAAEQASQNGVQFYQGNDSVWLADSVPAEFISLVIRSNHFESTGSRESG
jgi:putative RNA 2'-phosphotransferase